MQPDIMPDMCPAKTMACLMTVLFLAACGSRGGEDQPDAPVAGADVGAETARQDASAADARGRADLGAAADVGGEDRTARRFPDARVGPPDDVSPDACQPNCNGKECGPDHCGGSCGECPPDKPVCVGHTCMVGCEPNCTDRECGNDGCGGSCGWCPHCLACYSGYCMLAYSGDLCQDVECLADEVCAYVDGEAGFGCKCQTNEDCYSGLCVQVVGGKVCTAACVEECPADGWSCHITTFSDYPDIIYACAPHFPTLCQCRFRKFCPVAFRKRCPV